MFLPLDATPRTRTHALREKQPPGFVPAQGARTDKNRRFGADDRIISTGKNDRYSRDQKKRVLRNREYLLSARELIVIFQALSNRIH